jgi:hypothetical protein
MTGKRKRAQYRRNAKGASSIAEFGPALLVLLICIFFPLIDMLSVALSYGLCMVLNYNQVHEASLLPWQDATNPTGSVEKGIPDVWLGGMGHFVKVAGPPITSVTYRHGQKGTDGVIDKIVIVQTTVQCSPFLPIPIPWVTAPGLNAPFTFSVASERPMENPDYGQ